MVWSGSPSRRPAAPARTSWICRPRPGSIWSPSTWASASCPVCVQQVPPTTAQNTITPVANAVTGLTVKETTGTSADILDLQSAAGGNLLTVNAAGTVAITGLSTVGVVHNNASGV